MVRASIDPLCFAFTAGVLIAAASAAVDVLIAVTGAGLSLQVLATCQ